VEKTVYAKEDGKCIAILGLLLRVPAKQKRHNQGTT